ncbi:MAG: hypothetical protein HPY44_03560 [Armatimonadetes bacterium]|nr:hypothetical protein [Armatimonadota bacterium]
MADDLDLKVGISGVRGVVGQGLTVQVALEFARAFAGWSPGRRIALGRDTRVTGEMLRAAVVAGLCQSGRDVVDFGVLPVPAFQTAIRFDDTLSGGVYISASHNPEDENGLKFYRPDGIILFPDQAEEVIAAWRKGLFSTVAYDKIGAIECAGGAMERHVERIASLVDCDLIRRAQLTVVIDCNNGAGCLCAGDLLSRLGVAKLDVMNAEPTGRFTHKPEPVPAHMKQLAARVAELGYHIGFSQDPDADRVSIAACVPGKSGVRGMAIGEEYTLALGAASVAAQARENGQHVVMACNTSTSRMIEQVAEDYGFDFDRSPVGEVNVVLKLQELLENARRGHPGADVFAFGGEGGGGIIDGRNQYCRDSLNSIALILQGLARWKLSRDRGDLQRPGDERLLLDHWRRSVLPPCVIVKDSMRFGSLRQQNKVLKAVFRHLLAADVPQRDKRDDDGVRVRYPDGSWVHVRPSNTEPIVRFIAEHDTTRKARALVDEAMQVARDVLG